MYLPLAGASMLTLCLAGAEFTIYLQRVALQHRARQAEYDRLEGQAVERQRTFNQIWQQLADSRGESIVPESVLKELTALFSADLVAAWESDKAGSFHLSGAYPVANDGAVRLDKVAHMSPCFEGLRNSQTQLRTTDITKQTSKALAWFCEENGFQQIVLNPVLVRRDLVGVLAIFYKDKPAISTKLAEEMQSAANLFLCAL